MTEQQKTAAQLVDQATALWKAGKYVEAIALCDEAIKLDPNYAPAFSRRGTAKDYLRRHEEAIKDCDEAIRLKPNYADAYNNRGNAKYHVGQLEEVVKDCSIAIKIEPKKPNAYAIRGLAYFGQKEYKRAIEDFDNYLSKNPANSFIFSMRGKARIQLKNYPGALEDLKEALRLNPEDKEVANILEQASKEVEDSTTTKEHDETKRVLEESAQTVPSQAEVSSLGLRRETAVFIDICNSTDLIHLWEADHYVRVFGVLKQIVEKYAAQFNKLFIKGLGDGYMVIFASNDEALHFALNVIEGVATHNSSDQQDNMKFEIRIGIECGIVKPFDGDDRFGVCINRASRIEGLKKASFTTEVILPETNRILVSYIVSMAVNKKADFHFELIGSAHLRGIGGGPTEIYLVTRPTK